MLYGIHNVFDRQVGRECIKKITQQGVNRYPYPFLMASISLHI